MKEDLEDEKETAGGGVPEGADGSNAEPPEWARDPLTAYRIVQRTWKQAGGFRVARNDERRLREYAEAEVARLKAELEAARSRKEEADGQ